jgi:hypothetical protein
MGVLSSTSWFIINLLIYLLLFRGRKPTTKCISLHHWIYYSLMGTTDNGDKYES